MQGKSMGPSTGYASSSDTAGYAIQKLYMYCTGIIMTICTVDQSAILIMSE